MTKIVIAGGRILFTGLLLACLTACGQTTKNSNANTDTQKQEFKKTKNTVMENKMKVEIWSDVVCPFCYIGKRKFEAALEQFADREHVEIVWKSYQLMPDMNSTPIKSVYQLVSEKHGVGLEQSRTMHDQLTQTAKEVGLVYNFDKAIPVNTLKAHQLIQFAKASGKQEQAEETLFRSYFTDGKNIDDLTTLLDLGAEIGLDREALKETFDQKTYIIKVQEDISEAQKVGVKGVPFFVFDRKVAVSGAQDTKVFLETLKKTFAEWRTENPEVKLEVIEGKACTTEGECK